ncbi:MAG: alpha/beta hydrolase [Pseudomonadota bacterium]
MKFFGTWLALAALSIASPALSQTSPTAPGKLVQVGDITIHYVERGSGEPLLLLHGFGMCGKGDWGDHLDELAKTYRVIMPDLRGHGWSTNPSGKFTMRQSAEDIRGLLDQLGLKNIRAMGISAGGMTLLHLTAKYPDRVKTMALIGATNQFGDQARRVIKGEVSAPLPKEVRDMFDSCASRGQPQVRDLMAQFQSFASSYDDMNLTPANLATIKARTLIVHGDRDEFFPVEIPVEVYRAIPGSQLWIVPNGDHVPIYGSRLPEFLRITKAFLADPKPAR